MKPNFDINEFDRLTEPHRAELIRAANRLCGDSVTAEDMVQDTYLKAFKNFGSFKPGTNLRAWLFRILTNTVISNLRHKKVARETAYPAGFDLAGSPMAYPSNLDEGVSDELKEALAKLPDSQRQIFLLAALDDSTYDQIAEKLGIPVGTVMSRLWRARQVLKDSLTAEALN